MKMPTFIKLKSSTINILPLTLLHPVVNAKREVILRGTIDKVMALIFNSDVSHAYFQSLKV